MAFPGAAARGLQARITAFSAAVRHRDGQGLASLLKVVEGEQLELVSAGLLSLPADLVHRVPDQLGDTLLLSLQAMAAYHSGRHADAYAFQQQTVTAFLSVFRAWDTTWAMPAMHVAAFDLRVLAARADAELAAAGKRADCLNGAGRCLMTVFGALAGKGPKRRGSLYVACQLFKIYFRLRTLHLSKSIIRVIDAAKGFEEFPTRDQVTFRYYTGRLEVFNDSFAEADRRLGFALERCHAAKTENMRMVLKYLIPVRLCRGVLPSGALLQRFRLPEYEGIVAAMKSGDVRLLRDTLEEHEDEFLRAGVLLVLEKLELHVYRRMIRRIYLILREKDPSRGHQIRMASMLRALQFMGMADVDSDEMACVVATLIHRNFIRGYFSHKAKVLVLSKQQPFPPIASCTM